VLDFETTISPASPRAAELGVKAVRPKGIRPVRPCPVVLGKVVVVSKIISF